MLNLRELRSFFCRTNSYYIWTSVKTPRVWKGWGVLSRFLSEACSNKSPTPLWLFNLRIRAFENKKGKHVVRPTRIAQLLTPSSSSCSSSSSLEEREPQHPLTLFYLFYFLFFSSSRRKPSYGIYALFASIQCICMLVIMWWSEVCPKVLVVCDAGILFPPPHLIIPSTCLFFLSFLCHLLLYFFSFGIMWSCFHLSLPFLLLYPSLSLLSWFPSLSFSFFYFLKTSVLSLCFHFTSFSFSISYPSSLTSFESFTRAFSHQTYLPLVDWDLLLL